jgi:DUF971 family protein
MTITISKVSQNDSGLDVEWDDGEKSSFNFLWLRDNCPTSIHPYARHRILIYKFSKIKFFTCLYFLNSFLLRIG